ncbi:MAG: hypothetical protein IT436_11860 [Phycisphaerales bacterium]|nr:hypothetical protein [Phycisphaerales bacterium]
MTAGPAPSPVSARPGVEEAKAALLADDLDFSAGSLVGEWVRGHALPVVAVAGIAGVLLARSRTLRRITMAALLAPAVRREVMRHAAEIIRSVTARR